MTYLSEDPTFLIGGLLLVAGGFAAALRFTQEGKYLVYAAIAAALALGVFVVEQLWVTDGERIEQVVYGLRDAVAASNVDGVLGYMDRNVLYTRGELSLSPDDTRAYIRESLSHAHFDMVKVMGLEITVAEQARRGTANFRVLVTGSVDSSFGPVSGRSALTAWSLGLRETEPGVWKVYRIAPVSVPNDALAPPNEMRGDQPAAVDGEGRSRRRVGRGGGGVVDPRFYGNDTSKHAQPPGVRD
ncbi:MAG: hypothetical protein ACYC61_32400 [Isosphaeraceae bacterium]